jgi:hypothetical protein
MIVTAVIAEEKTRVGDRVACARVDRPAATAMIIIGGDHRAVIEIMTVLLVVVVARGIVIAIQVVIEKHRRLEARVMMAKIEQDRAVTAELLDESRKTTVIRKESHTPALRGKETCTYIPVCFV